MARVELTDQTERMARVELIDQKEEQPRDIIAKALEPTNIKNERENTTDWLTPFYDMKGLQHMVRESTILPQCITAYKNNIAGFGIVPEYNEEYDKETEEMKAEWDSMQSVLDLLTSDKSLKSVFEDIIECRETNGIAFVEVIRNAKGLVTEIDLIKEPETINKTVPGRRTIRYDKHYKGKTITRQKQFCRYRQMKNGKTVYFKEFGDPRIMDKRSGAFIKKGEKLALRLQANEIIEFPVGTKDYGTVRWEGQILTAEGSRLAETLNYRYFTNGRHIPLAIIVKNGTLSKSSFEKLKGYVNDIKGENGQHAFMVLEAETAEDGTAFENDKKVEIELKDLSPMLQEDALFTSYLDDNRKKVQSSFRLPDIYVGYTTDFNRATVQAAIEITEQQVFIPERENLTWTINNKLLDCYNFKYVKAVFKNPKIVNYEDLAKVLAVVKSGGGATPNDLKGILYDAIGKPYEDFEEDWGNIPIDIYNKKETTSSPNNSSNGSHNIIDGVDDAMQEASNNGDDEIVSVLKELRNMLIEMSGEGENEEN